MIIDGRGRARGAFSASSPPRFGQTAKLASKAPQNDGHNPTKLDPKSEERGRDVKAAVECEPLNRGNALIDNNPDNRDTAKRKSVDCSTLTELHSSSSEVEIVSLVGETLPKYKLRADYITEFAGCDNNDFAVVDFPALDPALKREVRVLYLPLYLARNYSGIWFMQPRLIRPAVLTSHFGWSRIYEPRNSGY